MSASDFYCMYCGRAGSHNTADCPLRRAGAGQIVNRGPQAVRPTVQRPALTTREVKK